MGSSIVGSERDAEIASGESRWISCLSEGSLSPTPRVHHLALHRPGTMA